MLPIVDEGMSLQPNSAKSIRPASIRFSFYSTRSDSTYFWEILIRFDSIRLDSLEITFGSIRFDRIEWIRYGLSENSIRFRSLLLTKDPNQQVLLFDERTRIKNDSSEAIKVDFIRLESGGVSCFPLVNIARYQPFWGISIFNETS